MGYNKMNMTDSTYQIIARFFIFYIPLLFSLCVHEWAHARVAFLKGDTLARDEGRLTLNPVAHADIMGTVILPLVSIFANLPVFGWAKPVPVNIRVLKKPQEDMFWIAFAGPLSNFLLSLAGTIFLTFVYVVHAFFDLTSMTVLISLSQAFIYINLLLGFFNLIPLHPLDGGKVLARFLPYEWNWRLEQWESYTSFILIALFLIGGFRYLAYPSYWLSAQFINVAQQMSHWLLLT